MMVMLNRTLRGVAKSLVIPIALAVGSIAYYALFDGSAPVDSAASFEGLFLSEKNRTSRKTTSAMQMSCVNQSIMPSPPSLS